MVTFIFVVMVMLLHQPTLIYSFGTTTIGRSLPQQPSAVPSLRQYSPSRRKGLLLSPMGAAPTFSRTNAIKTMNMINAYGRGAEIWPECNEDAVQLADSFPNGHIPFSAIIDIERADMNMMHQRVEISIEEGEDVDGTLHTVRKKKVLGNNTTGRKRQYMKRILRRAAAKEEIDIEGEITPIDRTPIAIGLALVLRGLVRPKDILVAASLTAYITILGMVAQSTARDFADITGTAAPILPAIPPQGHVPTILLHPLGRRMEESRLYDTWLKLGVAVGMVGPVVLLMRYILTHNLDAARFCARPLFLLCCQVVTEAVCSRRIMVSKSEESPIEMNWIHRHGTVSLNWTPAFFPPSLPGRHHCHYVSSSPLPTIRPGWHICGHGLPRRRRSWDRLAVSSVLPMHSIGP